VLDWLETAEKDFSEYLVLGDFGGGLRTDPMGDDYQEEPRARDRSRSSRRESSFYRDFSSEDNEGKKDFFPCLGGFGKRSCQQPSSHSNPSGFTLLQGVP
jgi:hypothetical protein